MLLIIKILLMCWAGVSLIIFTFQRLIIYSPDKTPPHLSRFDKKTIQEIHWKNAENILLMGFYHPANKHQPTLMIFHGNSGNIGSRKILMHHLIDMGYGVLMPEYRGYGGVAGFPTEKGLYQDASSAILYLKSMGVDENHIIVFGESLGASVALEMALIYPVAGLILQAPFLSLQSMAKLHYPWNILPVLDDFNNQSKIEKLVAPLLILHGTSDEVVPVEQGKILYSKANAVLCKRIELLKGQSHNVDWDEAYFKHIRDYIEQDIYFNHAPRLHGARY